MTQNHKCPHRPKKLDILHAMAKWHKLIRIGNKFFIKTNYLILKHLLMQGTLIEEQQKWIDHLQTYEFESILRRVKRTLS